MYPNQQVREIVEVAVAGVRETLEGDLYGIYLRGSLVLGDFNPETSDVDLLIVVGRDLGAADFERLDAMHRRIQRLPNRYANEVELAYVPLADINGFRPGKRYISLERGEGLRWKVLRHNWAVEFWGVREQGIALFGPEPRRFIEPISVEHVVEAIRLELSAWQEWADSPEDPGWHATRGTLRFAVETMCRVMYSLERHELCSKPVAVRWALRQLEEPWKALVQESQGWGSQPSEPDAAGRTQDFIRWVVHSARGLEGSDERP